MDILITLMLFIFACKSKNGYHIEEHKPGQMAEGNYKDGERIGLWVFYNENEQLIVEGNYISDEPSGLWKYYSDSGQLKSEAYFENGVQHGQAISYFENGKICLINLEKI